jgi:transposase-like protein
MLAGELVKELAVELEVSDATLYKWRRRACPQARRSAPIP